jgi:hypothetical protein
MPRDAEGVGGGPGMFAVAPSPKPARTATIDTARKVFFLIVASI